MEPDIFFADKSSMGLVRKEPISAEYWSQWVDGLHEALNDAKLQVASERVSVSRERLNGLMRSFHVIKGYAQSLGLHGVQAVAHGLESRVVELLERRNFRLDRELHAVFIDGICKLERVMIRMHEVQLPEVARGELGLDPVFIKRQSTVFQLFLSIESAARGIALDLGREVHFEIKGGSEITLVPVQWTALEGALLHAVRNSLDHGTKGLTEVLRMRLSAVREGSSWVIECCDSGVGIDPARVREVARCRHERFDAEMGSMTDDEVLQLLFLPGLSLSRGVSRLSGRGYGLDIVREAVEIQLSGKARIESRPGEGTRLVLRIPVRD